MEKLEGKLLSICQGKVLSGRDNGGNYPTFISHRVEYQTEDGTTTEGWISKWGNIESEIKPGSKCTVYLENNKPAKIEKLV